MSPICNLLPYRNRHPRLLALAACVLGALTGIGAVPPAEKLLPPETLAVISAPDWSKLREVYKHSPQSQFWDDPAMKPFREKFQAKWTEDFVKPLERDLGVKLDDYGSLLQGQLTLAVTQEGWQGKEKDDGEPGLLLLLDARDKAEVLRKNLAELRKKWSEAGKPVKTEKIRDIEFLVVPLTTNDVPKTLKQFFPQRQPVEELGKESAKPGTTDEVVIGQHDSLLIIGTTLQAAEKVVTRLTGSTAPTLAEQADFEASRAAVFRDAPIYGWFNAKIVVELLARTLSHEKSAEAPSPLPMPSPAKLISASGLNGVKTVAAGYRELAEGRLLDVFIAAPEAGRVGLTRLLSLASKDSSAPAFVPADAVKFQRTRLDGQKAIATIEKMLGEVSVEMVNTWNFLLSNANEAMRVNDAGYDIRKNLFGNLGDDIITYEKLPSSQTTAGDPPSLILISSPNPDQLAAALKGLFIFLPDGGSPQTREFLGKKIYSIKLSSLPGSGAQAAGRSLSYAASAGYVAFSTDAATLEEFLRSSEGQAKPLRDVPGLADAMSRVGGQSAGWFAYENESETMKLLFAALRAGAGDTNRPAPSVLGSTIPFASPEKQFRDWLDFSLLPDYEKVARYFSFAVEAGSANVDGITFKFFSPTPPTLKQ